MRTWSSCILLVVVFLGIIALVLYYQKRTPHMRPPASERDRCLQNIKNLGATIGHWEKQHGRFPDSRAQLEPPASWRVMILPTMGQQEVFRQYHLQESWESDRNHSVAKLQLDIFSCPSFRSSLDSSGRHRTSYALVLGATAVARPTQSLTRREVSDGTANTMLLGEACGLGIVWTEPRDINSDVSRHEILTLNGVNNGGKALLSSYHKGGVHVLMADGSGRFLHRGISKAVLSAMITADAQDDDR